jgi:replicative DNA helicase
MIEEWEDLQKFVLGYIFFKGKEKALHKAQSRLKKEHFSKHYRAIWMAMVRYNTQTMGMVDMDGLRGVFRSVKAPEEYLLTCEQCLLDGEERAKAKDDAFFLWTVGRLEEIYRVIKFEEIIEEGGAKVKAEGYFPARDYMLTSLSNLESSYVDSAPDGLLRSEVDDFIQEVASARDKKVSSSVDFGFEALDSVVLGLRGGDMTLVASWTGVGKTTFCLNVGVHVACIQKKNVVIITTETIRQQLRRRIYSRMTKLPVFSGYVPVSSQKLKSGQLSDAEQGTLLALSDYMKQGEHGELMIAQAPSRATMDWLRGKLLQYESMFKVDLLILDDIRNMVPAIRRRQEYEEMGELLRDLKRLARTHANRGIPVITPYHINRETYKKIIEGEGKAGGALTLSGLSSSAEAERQADIGLFLWKDDNSPGVIEVTVLKMRDGASGGSFRLQADLDYQHLSQSIISTNFISTD